MVVTRECMYKYMIICLNSFASLLAFVFGWKVFRTTSSHILYLTYGQFGRRQVVATRGCSTKYKVN